MRHRFPYQPEMYILGPCAHAALYLQLYVYYVAF